MDSLRVDATQCHLAKRAFFGAKRPGPTLRPGFKS